ncbi:hypothetical protein DAEQUDRAFT_770277 [Daedalea quercina L-15889]|uniref:DNA 3'-5' helicase n=1 Tax=Daedalea quercina L-15889 TaxID=1314783 RepID=A0A165KZR2_9APHY|nr:hypothetical protein DAEQUDRAFT_770277 [Daedalea quercina L-15889]
MALEDGLDKMIVIVTPLNLLGKQNVDLLATAGISGVAIDAKNANNETFKAVEAGDHRVVVVNPEIVMQEGGHFEKLWKKPSFTSRLLYIVFDEGHCVKEWSSFRTQYKHIGSLCYLIPETIPFYVASATLPSPLLLDVADILHLRPDHTTYILRSNDHPDVHLAVRKMQYAAASFKDLDWLIPNSFKDFKDGDSPPKKFLIFFDSTKEAEKATKYLQARLPEPLQDKIKWFHSIMSPEYRSEEYEALRNSDIWGLCVTDSFGMGLDLPDIQLIVQWKVPTSLNTIWQRFGRGARADQVEADAVLITEKHYFDDEHAERDARNAQRRANAAKRKKKQKVPDSPSKRQAIADAADKPAREQQPSTSNPDGQAEPQGLDDSDVEVNDAQDDGEEGLGAESEQLVSVEEARVVDIDERRATYNKHASPGTKVTTSQREKVLHPAVDDFINAMDRGFKCRQKPIALAYSNDERDWDDIDCDPPTGCTRCAPKVSIICCDLCHPDAFEYLKPLPKVTKEKAMKKSTIKKHEPGKVERELRTALFKWRDTKSLEVFGLPVFLTYSGDLFMSVDVIQRVIDCAHAGKLTTITTLKHELEWNHDWIESYGNTLLAIVGQICPLPASNPAPPLATRADNSSGNQVVAAGGGQGSNTAGPSRKWKPPTCSRCGQQGHNACNSRCPQNGLGCSDTAPSNENTAPH